MKSLFWQTIEKEDEAYPLVSKSSIGVNEEERNETIRLSSCVIILHLIRSCLRNDDCFHEETMHYYVKLKELLLLST